MFAQFQINMLLVLIRPLHFAAEGSATCVTVFQHCMNIESVQYYTIICFASLPAPTPLEKRRDVRMSKHHICFLLFVILSNECDNHVSMVMVHFNTSLPNQFFVFFFLSKDNSLRFSPIFWFYFFFGSAYLLYNEHRFTSIALSERAVASVTLLHTFLFLISFHEHCWDGPASYPVPPEPLRRVSKERITSLETRAPRLGLFLRGTGNS